MNIHRERFKSYREARMLSRQEAAKMCGLSHETIRKLEETGDVSLGTLRKFLDGMGLSVAHAVGLGLLGDEFMLGSDVVSVTVRRRPVRERGNLEDTP